MKRYLAGGFECFAASPGTAGAAIPGDRTKAYITLGILIVAALLFNVPTPLDNVGMLSESCVIPLAIFPAPSVYA